ncbi:zinc finger BED domain-containing protein RICESLEEPER 2-like [Senna tora]|uniref:Zinc finger BED domain-containing protein RICESLEEPER 2-like n=1 Tax=Senna tora TaxID=362788 RepID=A0A834W1T3_9FABA|nr:zinc finger BED domain-containing protein RICESLEEPER 2-like [Senna tora]
MKTPSPSVINASNVIDDGDDIEILEKKPIEKESEPPKKRGKKETSNVWNFFKKIGKGADGIQRAACIGCKQEFKTGGTYGTSHLHRHVSSCNFVSYHDVSQMLINQEGKLKSKKIDQQLSRQLCAEAIIEHDLPYSFVDYKGIRKWIKYLNPDVIMPSRNTVVSDVKKIYEKEKEKLKQEMARIPNRVCLTSDVWTACTSEGYICLTAHFVDENWKLRSIILNFCRMLPPHTGVELSNTILNCLKEWSLEKKVFSLTLDNASSNDNMQDILKRQLCLNEDLLCDGDYFHIRCSAHILNLIVQEGLKVASDALHKIRESVKYVKASDGRMQKFDDCVRESGGVETGLGVRLDVTTRWNSTYLMLESALHYQKAFTRLNLIDRNYKYCPSVEEWRRATKMREFLEPFFETTNLISGSKYPTSNLYFMQVWKIECMLNASLTNEDEVIRDMTHRMKVKFDKYWSEYSEVLAFGAILDPRSKLEFLQFCYSEIDPLTSEVKVQNVRMKLYKLYKQYEKRDEESSSTPQSQLGFVGSLKSTAGSENPIKTENVFCRFKNFKNHTSSSAGKSELDQYLDEAALDSDFYEDLEVLQYWKDVQKRFPHLSIMARDVLSIPITTVASESAFSMEAMKIGSLPRNNSIENPTPL